MKKITRKIFSPILAVALIVASSLPALAAGYDFGSDSFGSLISVGGLPIGTRESSAAGESLASPLSDTNPAQNNGFAQNENPPADTPDGDSLPLPSEADPDDTDEPSNPPSHEGTAENDGDSDQTAPSPEVTEDIGPANPANPDEPPSNPDDSGETPAVPADNIEAEEIAPLSDDELPEFPENPDPDLVYDWTALETWLETNTWGTVTLGADITVNGITTLPPYPITIDTGEYGLIFDGGFLFGNADVQITGRGADKPVVTVIDLGRIFIGNWCNYLTSLNITATGYEGEGGTALRIHTSGSGRMDFLSLELGTSGKIRAYGEGAVGIELMDPFDLFGFDVAAYGEKGVAVLAHADVALCFSRISAEGSGALAVLGEAGVVIDTSLVSPLPDGDNIEIFKNEFFPVYLPIPQHTAPASLSYMLTGNKSVAYLSGGSSTTLPHTPVVQWDYAVYADIDLDTLGRTTVTGSLYSSWLPEFIGGTPEIVIDVRDQNLPCISGISIHRALNEDESDKYVLEMWEPGAWTWDDCILWSSDDGGYNWSNCTGMPGFGWEDGAVIPVSSVSNGTIFVVEVGEVGFSNIIRFSSEHGMYFGDTGGDRIGTDRLSIDLGLLGISLPDSTNSGGNPGEDGGDGGSGEDGTGNSDNGDTTDNSGDDYGDDGSDNNSTPDQNIKDKTSGDGGDSPTPKAPEPVEIPPSGDDEFPEILGEKETSVSDLLAEAGEGENPTATVSGSSPAPAGPAITTVRRQPTKADSADSPLLPDFKQESPALGDNAQKNTPGDPAGAPTPKPVVTTPQPDLSDYGPIPYIAMVAAGAVAALATGAWIFLRKRRAIKG